MDSLQQALSQLINFYDSPMGLALYRAEKRMLETYITNIFGYHLLQIGGPEDLSWLKSSPIRNHHRFSDCINNVDVASACYGKLDMLPFVSEGIDLIFLPHTLNLLQDTTAVLTEVKRCLATEGRLIIINFVPYRMFYWQCSFQSALPNIYWHSYNDIHRVLDQLGFNIKLLKSFFHKPYINNDKILQKLYILDAIGRTFCSWLGNVQMIVAQKNIFGLTPVTKNLKNKPKLILNGNIAPTLRKRS